MRRHITCFCNVDMFATDRHTAVFTNNNIFVQRQYDYGHGLFYVLHLCLVTSTTYRTQKDKGTQAYSLRTVLCVSESRKNCNGL
jgi:hypothetical protein